MRPDRRVLSFTLRRALLAIIVAIACIAPRAQSFAAGVDASARATGVSGQAEGAAIVDFSDLAQQELTQPRLAVRHAVHPHLPRPDLNAGARSDDRPPPCAT